MENNGISILISTFNGVSRLSKTLESLAKLDILGISFVELILIDNASTDNTFEFSKKKWSELGAPFKMKLLYEKKSGKFHAQESGLKIAKGEYILICDDDNLLFSNYLQVGFQYLSNNFKVGVLGGKGIPKSDIKLPIWFEEYSYNFACGKQALKTGNVVPIRNVVYGAGMWFRKELYLNAKLLGFNFTCNFSKSNEDSKLFSNGGEDSELCWAIRFQGAEIWYIDSLCFYHNLPQERLTDQYLANLKSRVNSNGPYGAIYSRVFYSNWIIHVKLFWMKELIHSFIYLFKILMYLNIKNRKIEIKRTFKNIFFYCSERSKYDLRVNHLIDYKSNILKQFIEN